MLVYPMMCSMDRISFIMSFYVALFVLTGLQSAHFHKLARCLDARNNCYDNISDACNQSKLSRFELAKCAGKSHVLYTKCTVPRCLIEVQNCFHAFHNFCNYIGAMYTIVYIQLTPVDMKSTGTASNLEPNFQLKKEHNNSTVTSSHHVSLLDVHS